MSLPLALGELVVMPALPRLVHSCLHFISPDGAVQAWQLAARRGREGGNARQLASDRPGGRMHGVAGLGILQTHAYMVATALADDRSWRSWRSVRRRARDGRALPGATRARAQQQRAGMVELLRA